MIIVDASYLAAPLVMRHSELCEMTLMSDAAVSWAIAPSTPDINRRFAEFVVDLARYELCFMLLS